MIKGKKLDHIGLAVNDVEKNAQWYQDILGFSVKGKFIDDNEKHVYFLESNGTTYEMYQDDSLPADAIGKIDHISYTSNDIETDYKFCVGKGYKICTEGIEEISQFWDNGCRYFKILSPAGEQVEFCQII